MKKTILTPEQKIALHLFSETPCLVENFVFSGGTALAEYYLQHRLSDDLDFFSENPVQLLQLEPYIGALQNALQAESVSYNRLYDRHLFFVLLKNKKELKVEFTYYPFQRFEQPVIQDGIAIESLRDLCVNKFATMFDRFEPKDYVDLYFLLSKKHTTLHLLQMDAAKKFHMLSDPLLLAAVFERAARLHAIPHLLEPIEMHDVHTFFREIVQTLRPNVME